jgi:hypothetical protein
MSGDKYEIIQDLFLYMIFGFGFGYDAAKGPLSAGASTTFGVSRSGREIVTEGDVGIYGNGRKLTSTTNLETGTTTTKAEATRPDVPDDAVIKAGALRIQGNPKEATNFVLDFHD